MPGWRLFPLVVSLATVVVAAQAPADARVRQLLGELFAGAIEFSPKGGEPPHFKAFVADPRTRAKTQGGVAFWTTELAPLERGYDGPIRILVGMDLQGVLTGISVVDHHEPYGYFSVDLPEFAAQFRGKSIRDSFVVGRDVDAVSRATLTVASAARAVRISARKAAKALLPAPQ
jgi:NosR/NirI family nitrous oxide reductase transcriptional regulator